MWHIHIIELHLVVLWDKSLFIISEQLLEGFFSFYSAFNFDTSVICPKTGKTALLSEILHLDSCPADAKDFRVINRVVNCYEELCKT